MNNHILNCAGIFLRVGFDRSEKKVKTAKKPNMRLFYGIRGFRCDFKGGVYCLKSQKV